MNCSFGSQFSPCVPLGLEQTTTIPLKACKRDISSHLVSLGVSGKRWRATEANVNEEDLLLNRAGLFGSSQNEIQAMTVCSKHRKELTVLWPGRKQTTCCYPSHQGARKPMKSPRRINSHISDKVYEIYQVVIPIGSGKCHKVFTIWIQGFNL